MKKIVENYELINEEHTKSGTPLGDSASPKNLIFHIFENSNKEIHILDIGFGSGSLGRLIKSNPNCTAWKIDGVDGWGQIVTTKN